MKVLLDTHVLLWWLADAPELSPTAREIVRSPEHVVFVSAASVWEIRIKEALGKVRVGPAFEQVLAKQPFEKLAITLDHAHAVRELPLHHRDPFDRMLIAQARAEELALVTHDGWVSRYDVEHVLV